MSQAFNIIIELGIIAPGHGREVVYGINATDKRFIFHLMDTVELNESQSFDTQIEIDTTTHSDDVSLLQ